MFFRVIVFVLSMVSGPLSLHVFYVQFAGSQTVPSQHGSSMAMASDTAIGLPSLTAGRPKVSSLVVSASRASVATSSPFEFGMCFPFFSDSRVTSYSVSTATTTATFVYFPGFNPDFLGSRFAFFAGAPTTPSAGLVSFAFASFVVELFATSVYTFYSSSGANAVVRYDN